MVRRVLLQPDTETIVSDVEQICAEHTDWTSDDCLKVEQNIVVLAFAITVRLILFIN